MPSEATAEENKFTSDTENEIYQGEIWPLQQMEGRLEEVAPRIATKKGEEPEESFSVLSSPMLETTQGSEGGMETDNPILSPPTHDHEGVLWLVSLE